MLMISNYAQLVGFDTFCQLTSIYLKIINNKSSEYHVNLTFIVFSYIFQMFNLEIYHVNLSSFVPAVE